MSFLQGLFGPPNVSKLIAKRNIHGLIKALRYRKDSDIRSRAAIGLGELRAAQAVDPLCTALSDREWHVRETAARALRLGYSWGEAGWVLEDNVNMIQAAEGLNGRLYKKYRLYEKGI